MPVAGCVYLSVLKNKCNKQLNVTLVVCFILLGKISKGQNNYGFCVCVINCLTDSPERMGKVAPSVFGGIGSGAETAIEKPKPPATSVFGK